MSKFTNVPARLRPELQQRLWALDAEADLVTANNVESSSQPPAAVSRMMQVTINGFRRTFGIERPIYFAVSLSKRIQACAIRLKDGTPVIVLWMGLALISSTSLYRLVKMPSLANAFGFTPDPSLALPPMPDLDPYDAFQRLREYLHAGPETAVEQEFMGGLNRDLINFSVLHELGHVVFGHLQILHGKAAISEAGGFFGDQKEILTRHALEKAADSFAFAQAMTAAIHRKLNHLEFLSPTIEIEFKISRLLLAVVFFCRLFEREAFVRGSKLNTHPPGSIRLMMLLPLMKTIWESTEALTSVPFDEHLPGDVLFMFENAVKELTGAPSLVGNLSNSVDLDWATEYHVTISKRLLELRPEFHRLSIPTSLKPLPNMFRIGGEPEPEWVPAPLLVNPGGRKT